ncbi:hypothetical protein SKAU_G00078980 [Synaphobranchus kaupii]|uniref:Uncharacterized protein n=1 Tax=Synaphobranchus kaupii TaxID=118154 RepID=A0A9Q1FVA1_SYNKA|nr:hypothetical protein SKAU_G00078980 [Synaphobranchus kaupii]
MGAKESRIGFLSYDEAIKRDTSEQGSELTHPLAVEPPPRLPLEKADAALKHLQVAGRLVMIDMLVY